MDEKTRKELEAMLDNDEQFDAYLEKLDADLDRIESELSARIQRMKKISVGGESNAETIT